MSVQQFASASAAYEMSRSDLEALPENYADIECDYLADIMNDALSAMLLCPAPDLAAVAYKMEAFAAEECFGFCPHYRDPLFAALMADVRRLKGESKA